jgi:hypothetical protein
VRPLRLRSLGTGLAAITSVVLGAGALSACDASPVAASVNGTVIHQSTLLQQLTWWASSPDYIGAYNAQAAQEAQANNQQTSPQVLGDGTQTYGLQWTTQQLTSMIVQTAIEQKLASEGKAPTAEQYNAAWSAEWANFSNAWRQFPEALRTTVAQRDADQAVLGTTGNASSEQAYYKDHVADFFSQVCVRTAAVTGGLSQARAVASTLASKNTVTADSAGVVTCYTPEQLIEQPAAFTNQVVGLKVGQVGAPQAASFGYNVSRVTSRTVLAYNQTVANVIGIIEQGGSTQQSISDAKVIGLLKADKIHVDPGIGTWVTNTQYPPFILPAGEQIQSAPSGQPSSG